MRTKPVCGNYFDQAQAVGSLDLDYRSWMSISLAWKGKIYSWMTKIATTRIFGVQIL